ncbi:ABC transporter permease [Microbacterium sp. P07]|uniref:ABC transporter permease n=1 Tax=Microbacterium sp. P07 TaxID=3366952 RepID=UPI0037453F3E
MTIRNLPLPRGFARRRDRPRDPDRFSAPDLVAEVLAGLDAKPGRLVMTTVGVVIGVASLVTTIGLTQTSARNLSNQFDAVTATHATVQPAGSVPGGPASEAALPWSSVERVRELAGVEAAVLLGEIDTPPGSVTTAAVNDPSQPTPFTPTIAASSAGLLDTVGGHVVEGRMFDGGHATRHDRVVVLGSGAAERLNVHRVDNQPTVFLRGIPFAVIGIVDAVTVRTILLNSVIIPLGTAEEVFGLRAPATLDLRVTPGSGQTIARQVPIALDPNDPARFSVVAPPPPSELRRAVTADVDLVFLVLGLLALLGGGIGIANVTLASVAERTGEIGLRRALGAEDRDIRMQFILEPSITGLLGGLIGASLGVAAVTVVSLVQGWTPVIDIVAALAAAAAGALVGLLAGLAPARRATRIEPAAALRDGV